MKLEKISTTKKKAYKNFSIYFVLSLYAAGYPYTNSVS